MALFKNYKMLHDGIDCGITINGKTIDNFHPDQVGKFISGLPEVVRLMCIQNLQNVIDPDGTADFSEERRIYGFQPDYTHLKKELNKVVKIPLFLYQKTDGTFKMTESERELSNHKKVINHSVECPACNKRGIVGTEYCSICWGSLYVKQKSKIVIIPCDRKSYLKMKKNNIKRLPESDEDIRAGYPDWTSIKDIKSGHALSWDDLDDMC